MPPWGPTRFSWRIAARAGRAGDGRPFRRGRVTAPDHGTGGRAQDTPRSVRRRAGPPAVRCRPRDLRRVTVARGGPRVEVGAAQAGRERVHRETGRTGAAPAGTRW